MCGEQIAVLKHNVCVCLCGVRRDHCVFPPLLAPYQTAYTPPSLHLTISTHHFIHSNVMFGSFKDLST